MPEIEWWILGAVDVVVVSVALGILWRRGLRSTAHLNAQIDEMLPLIKGLVIEVRGADLTATGVRTKAIVTELVAVASDIRASARVLESNIEVVKRMSAIDRAAQATLMAQVERLMAEVESNVATLERMEVAGRNVAADLSVAQKAVDEVALDLSESHRRADLVSEGPHGAAADAAAQQTPSEKILEAEVIALAEAESEAGASDV